MRFGVFLPTFVGIIALVHVSCTKASGAGEDLDLPEEPQDNFPGQQVLQTPYHLNLRVNPVVALFTKLLSAELHFGVGESFSIGPAIQGQQVFSLAPSTLALYEFGISGAYYLGKKRFTEGFVIRPFWNFGNFRWDVLAEGDQIEGQYVSKSLGLVLGYQWFFGKGFNMDAGMGIKGTYSAENVRIFSSGSDKSPSSDISKGISLVGDFSVGWAF